MSSVIRLIKLNVVRTQGHNITTKPFYVAFGVADIRAMSINNIGNSEYTTLQLKSTSYNVIETPEQILEILAEDGCKVVCTQNAISIRDDLNAFTLT